MNPHPPPRGPWPAAGPSPALALTVAVAVALAGASPGARAAGCTLPVPAAGGATLLDFGAYSRFGGTLDVVGLLGFTCSGAGLPVPYALSANRGLNSGSFDARRMVFAGSALSYNIYTDATRAVIWGDGTGGTQTINGLCPPGAACTVSVYGRLPGGQGGPPGPYADALTVTVAF